jgi:hypothetical protein
MIQKLVSDIINQFIIEFKKQETYDKIQNAILEPISKYIKFKTYPYINILLFILILYSITQPIILIILFRQNRMVMSILKQISDPLLIK